MDWQTDPDFLNTLCFLKGMQKGDEIKVRIGVVGAFTTKDGKRLAADTVPVGVCEGVVLVGNAGEHFVARVSVATWVNKKEIDAHPEIINPRQIVGEDTRGQYIARWNLAAWRRP